MLRSNLAKENVLQSEQNLADWRSRSRIKLKAALCNFLELGKLDLQALFFGCLSVNQLSEAIRLLRLYARLIFATHTLDGLDRLSNRFDASDR